MFFQKWKPYFLWILLAEGVGALSGWLTKDAMVFYGQTISQPPLSPPGWIFPVVWGILYALMGWSAARVSLAPASGARSLGLNLFIVQLAVNFFWSLIFFNLLSFGFAFFWLLLLLFLVVWMISAFRKTDKAAAKLQIPYLLWLSFATYLNLGVWYLNR